jgi:hypothetical protein
MLTMQDPAPLFCPVCGAVVEERIMGDEEHGTMDAAICPNRCDVERA